MIGSGTESDPYLIISEEQLIDFFTTKKGYANLSRDVVLNENISTRKETYYLNLKGFTLTVNDSSGTEEIFTQNAQGYRRVSVSNGNIICNINKAVSKKVITKSAYHSTQIYNSTIDDVNVVFNVNCQGTVSIGILWTTNNNPLIKNSVIRSASPSSVPDMITCNGAYIVHTSSEIKPGNVSYSDIPLLDRNKWVIDGGNPVVVKQFKRHVSGTTLVAGVKRKRKVLAVSLIDHAHVWTENSSDDGSFRIPLGEYPHPVLVIASDITSGVLSEGLSVIAGEYYIAKENNGKKYHINNDGVLKNMPSPLPTQGEFTSGDVIIRVEDISPSSSVGPVNPASIL